MTINKAVAICVGVDTQHPVIEEFARLKQLLCSNTFDEKDRMRLTFNRIIPITAIVPPRKVIDCDRSVGADPYIA